MVVVIVVVGGGGGGGGGGGVVVVVVVGQVAPYDLPFFPLFYSAKWPLGWWHPMIYLFHPMIYQVGPYDLPFSKPAEISVFW